MAEATPYQCLGCAVGHAADARTLLAEAMKFYGRGEAEKADAHVVMALGHLAEAEYQSAKWPDVSRAVGKVRKRVEAKFMSGKPPGHEDLDELVAIAVKAAKIVRESPESCPTCRFDLAGARPKSAPPPLRELRELLSDLNIRPANPKSGMAWREALTIVGSQFAGKGVDIALSVADEQLGLAGQPVHMRVRTWGSILGGVGSVLAGIFLFKDKPAAQLALTAFGGYLLTNIVDVVQEVAPAAGAAATAAPAFAPVAATPGAGPVPSPAEAEKPTVAASVVAD